MITPRRTRLVRVPDLQAFRRTIVTLSSEGSPRAMSRAVLVPTRGAARLARQMFPAGAAAPLFLTRDQIYEHFRQRLAEPPRRLNPFERDSIVQSAAEQAARAVSDLSFQLRPGLVAEMLRFYDHLRRQSQIVKRFEELIQEALGGDAAADRGAERMLAQTRFLSATFREYERRLVATGACDEHLLRERLIEEPASDPFRRLVVTVADWIADPDGLFVADFDLVSRIPGLEAIDLLSTDAVLRSGFHERIHRWWPGLEEVEAVDLNGDTPTVCPALLTPTGRASEQSWFTYRDREEELVAVARRIGGESFREYEGAERSPAPLFSVVFKRPLPYLYLAPDTLGAAGIPYQTFDALPLAAEPTAATIDVVLEFVETNFARDAIVALLETPHLRFVHQEREISRQAVSTLNRALSAARYLGDLDRLTALAAEGLPAKMQEGRPALEAGVAAARQLYPLLERASASQQIRRFLTFIVEHLRVIVDTDLFALRERRARVAVLDLLSNLAAAHESYHDPSWTVEDLATAVRRWIGEETFVPEGANAGVYLIDDQAARYGAFDDMTLVGLVDNEWPERSRRDMFYPLTLLKALGWPSENDRRSGEDARFIDLVKSASRQVMLSTFTLDNETLVTRSTLLDDLTRTGLSAINTEPADGLNVPDEETLSGADAADFHGFIGPQAPQSWSVSALETYLACPFKFFAQYVLCLEEEPDDEEVMDPRRQGQLVHAVFEAFFTEWQASGHGAITPQSLQEAQFMFSTVVERSLSGCSEAEAGLERTRLLGSAAAAGLGEAVFRMEAERSTPVVERLLEHPLKGPFTIATASGPRIVSLRGKVDRLDLLADGTFRLIDYKLGWPPDRTKALQLPIYGVCAEQTLEHRGRRWTLGEAVYLAFKGPKRVVPLFMTPHARDEVLAKAQQRLADTLDRIERGEFPPAPDDVFRCETCSFATVCRKDYVRG